MPSIYPECRHIHVIGRRCQSPALKDQPYCYFHSRSRMRHQAQEPAILHPLRADSLGQAEPTYAAPSQQLDFPPIEDRESIQLAVSMVLASLGRNALDTKRAATMLYALQVATAVTERDRDDDSPIYVEPEVTTAPDGTDLALLPEQQAA